MEGDSLNIITSLKETEDGGSGLLLDCKNMTRRGRLTRVTHMFGEANGGANWLANLGRTSKEVSY